MASEPRVLESKKIRDAWPPISEEELALPSGIRKRWIRLHLGTSAAVLAVTKEKEIVLTREYRHGIGRVAYSLPGGPRERANRRTPARAASCSKRPGSRPDGCSRCM